MVVQVPQALSSGTSASSSSSKYISPTLKLQDDVVVDSLQFHQDKSTGSSRGQLSRRFVQPVGLETKESIIRSISRLCKSTTFAIRFQIHF